MFGSVWSDLLVLRNYCVIISEWQKVTFLVVAAKKIGQKMEKKKKFLKIAWNGEKIDQKCFLNLSTKFLSVYNLALVGITIEK